MKIVWKISYGGHLKNRNSIQMYLPTLSIVLDSLSECIILLLLTDEAKRGMLSDTSLTKGQSRNKC